MPIIKKDYTIIILGIIFFILAIVYWPNPKHEQPKYPLEKITIYSEYSCPPVLTQEQCYKRIDLALVNDFDVDEYLFNFYNFLK